MLETECNPDGYFNRGIFRVRCRTHQWSSNEYMGYSPQAYREFDNHQKEILNEN